MPTYRFCDGAIRRVRADEGDEAEDIDSSITFDTIYISFLPGTRNIDEKAGTNRVEHLSGRHCMSQSVQMLPSFLE